MSSPLVRVDVKDYCFEAVLRMIKHNIHHMVVMKGGNLKGVLTNHDLMLLQDLLRCPSPKTSRASIPSKVWYRYR